jgi:hypothetical protein
MRLIVGAKVVNFRFSANFSPNYFAVPTFLRIFAIGIGEKSRAVDALAYYFALNRRSLGNLTGIVRFKKQGKGLTQSFSLFELYDFTT